MTRALSRRILLFKVEGRGVGDTYITGRHFGGGTHITSDMCAGIHISRGYTYHGDTHITVTAAPDSLKCGHETLQAPL